MARIGRLVIAIAIAVISHQANAFIGMCDSYHVAVQNMQNYCNGNLASPYKPVGYQCVVKITTTSATSGRAEAMVSYPASPTPQALNTQNYSCPLSETCPNSEPIQSTQELVQDRCIKGCKYNIQSSTTPGLFLCVSFPDKPGEGTFCPQHTLIPSGETCVKVPSTNPIAPPSPDPKLCTVTYNGKQACIGPDNTCPDGITGEVNGQKVCIPKVPDPCAINGDVSFCSPNAPQPQPYNQQGEPEPPADPETVEVNNGPNTPNVNIYINSPSLNGSYTPPPPPPPPDPDPPPPPQPECGGVGQPACNPPPDPDPDPDPPPSTCGGEGQPACPPPSTCGGEGQPACPPPSTCGGEGQPACPPPSTCGGEGQPACPPPSNCGGEGQPACPPPSSCGGESQPECPPDQCDPNAGYVCDDGEDGTASGGDTCGAPPSCANDPVNCAILHQIWLTRCAIEGDEEVEDDTDYGTDHTPDEGFLDETIDGFDFFEQPEIHECPSLEFSAFGEQFNLDETGKFCEFLQIGAMLIMLFAAITAARIVAGGVI